MPNEHQVMTLYPLAIEMYGCFHFHFDSFLITYAQTTIAHL
jgi:hypothetical protein